MSEIFKGEWQNLNIKNLPKTLDANKQYYLVSEEDLDNAIRDRISEILGKAIADLEENSQPRYIGHAEEKK